MTVTDMITLKCPREVTFLGGIYGTHKTEQYIKACMKLYDSVGMI